MNHARRFAVGLIVSVTVACTSETNSLDGNAAAGESGTGIPAGTGGVTGTGGVMGTGGMMGTGGVMGTGGMMGAGGVMGTGGSPTIFDVASFGATPNDGSDDTASLQKAVSMTPTGAIVFVPEGTFLIRTTNNGLRLRSNMILRLHPKAILRAIPSGDSRYEVVSVHGVQNVQIEGGTIEGDRDGHLGVAGEHGHCLDILSSQDIVVKGVTARKCWGDGFYVGRRGVEPRSTRITFSNVVADENRRQGLSVTDVSEMTVKDSSFLRTQGTLPQAGIDLEPNNPNVVENVTLTNLVLRGNAGNGLLAYVAPMFNSSVRNVRLENSKISDNGRSGVNFTGSAGGQIQGNEVTNNGGVGIALNGSSGFAVNTNTISGNAEGTIIEFGGSTGNTIGANTIR